MLIFVMTLPERRTNGCSDLFSFFHADSTTFGDHVVAVKAAENIAERFELGGRQILDLADIVH